MIKLRYDSRDKIFHQKFGQVIALPEECNFDTTLYDDVQPIGDVKCTCYSTCDIAEDQENREFDILDLWNRIPQSSDGADPRDVLSEAVKNGLLPKGQTERAKDWNSYWSALQGARDFFDNVRSAIIKSKSPVMCATYWQAEWLNLPAFGVMPVGKTSLNGHAWVVEGWKVVNGEPMLIVEAWLGRKLLMPRETFNQAMKPYGMQAWVLSTSDIDARRQKTILESIQDAIINIWLSVIRIKISLLQKEINELPKPTETKNDYQVVKEAVKEPVKENMIEKWAKAIDKWEGNTFGNNPGNLKYSPLIASFGAKKGKAGSDGGYFAVFDTPEQGFQALCKFLELGCKNELKSYKNARTLEKFMKIYAGNPHPNYIQGIANMLGASLNTDISTFL